MYLELSRPGGDITRWEKVLKRLNLLNKNYPLKAEKCDPETFRHSLSARSKTKQYYYQKEMIQNIIKDIVSNDNLVYIGGYANALYSRYLKHREKMFLNEIPEFDILSNAPDKTAKKIKEELEYFPVKFDQVKEKYGGLRLYFSGGDSYIEGIIDMAEEYSYKICEVCGNKGKPNKEGWITTLCEICRSKNESYIRI